MAIRLDASGDAVYRTSVPDTTGAVTVMAWVYLSVDRNDWSAVFSLEGSSTPFLWLGTNGTGTDLEIWDNGGGSSTSGSLSTGTWTHLALTKDATTGYTAYQDGLSIGTHTGTDTASTRFELGGDVYNEWFNGRFAYVKGWEQELTAAEIQAEMYSAYPKTTDNLYGWWPMFAGSTERTRDYSGNGNAFTAGGTLTDEAHPPVGYGAPVFLLPFEAAPPPAGAIMSQIQFSNLGADLYNGTIIA